MANWINDPQGREEVEKVTQELKLPIYKPSAKGKFRPWLTEVWGKLEDYLINLKNIANSKEPAISKKTGFNLDKTNLTENNSNKLFTAKGALDLLNSLTTKISEAVNAAKEYFRTELVKKIDKTAISSSLTSTSTATVASSEAVKSLEDKKLNIADAWRNYIFIIGDSSITTDLDNITQIGEYANRQNVNKFSNSPVTNQAFTLSVTSISPDNRNYRTQILSTYNTQQIYKRIKTESGWSNWWRIDAGDRLPLGGGIINGHLAINNSAPYLELRKSGVRSMVVGSNNSASDDIIWYADIHKTYVSLRKDDIYLNKTATVNGNISSTGSIEGKQMVQNTRNAGSWSVWKSIVNGGFWALEYNNNPLTSGNMRLNIYFNTGDSYNGSTLRSIAFPDISAKSETVAYQDWVTSQIKSQVSTINSKMSGYMPLVGNHTKTGNLTVTGTILANGNITAFSDKRLKKDIIRIGNALDKIEKINGYTFKMEGKEKTGLIAQEVKEVLQQAVIETDTKEKYLALDYGSLAGLFVESIKELKKEIDNLKKKVGV